MTENQNFGTFDLQNQKKNKGLEFFYTHQVGAEVKVYSSLNSAQLITWGHANLDLCNFMIIFIGFQRAFSPAKAEFAKEGTFFANRFPSLITFANKKLEF